MMKIAIITIAGVSSRFNLDIPEGQKRHKIIYYEKDYKNSLLYHLLDKCMFADRIILVGGNKYEDVQNYCSLLPEEMKNKIALVYNEHYLDYGSGYSLYIGLDEAFRKCSDIDDILFVEGDLDIDCDSFKKVVNAKSNVLTYSYEPIYTNKAVVLYKNEHNEFRYVFNSSHGLLKIDDEFSLIMNSGQLWKFVNVDLLKAANEKFYNEEKEGTNLKIIQNYIDLLKCEDFELIGLSRWTNCNTRMDYHKILSYWEEESK